MPIDVPSGPGGADRGKPIVPGAPCYLCEVVGGRTEKGIVEGNEFCIAAFRRAKYGKRTPLG